MAEATENNLHSARNRGCVLCIFASGNQCRKYFGMIWTTSEHLGLVHFPGEFRRISWPGQ